MSNFDNAVAHVLAEEGGYVHHSSDPGGETKYGISKRAYPNVDIKNLTVDQAKTIYKRDYWDLLPMDDLPDAVAFTLLDCAVNCGVQRAAILLQRACRVKEDGVIGPNTVDAAAKPGVLERFAVERIKFYVGLKGFDTFGSGWLARVVRVVRMA